MFDQIKLANSLLDETLILLDDGKGWTKGVDALDVDNKQVGAYNDKACKFCLQSAIIRSNHKLTGTYVQKANATVLGYFIPEGFDVPQFNDDIKTTFGMVKEFIDGWRENVNQF